MIEVWCPRRFPVKPSSNSGNISFNIVCEGLHLPGSLYHAHSSDQRMDMRARWYSLTIYTILYLSNLSTNYVYIYICIWGPHEVMILFELNNVLHHFHCSSSGAQPRRFGGSILQPPWRRWGYIRRWMRTRSSPHSSCLDSESYMSDGKWVWHQASGKRMEYEWGMIPKRHVHVLCHTLFLFDSPNMPQ